MCFLTRAIMKSSAYTSALSHLNPEEHACHCVPCGEDTVQPENCVSRLLGSVGKLAVDLLL